MSTVRCERWALAGIVVGLALWILGIFLGDDLYRPDWWWRIPTSGVLLIVAGALVFWKSRPESAGEPKDGDE